MVANAAPMHSSPAQVHDQAAEADLSSALSLANIRQTLIRLEDTIIFSLIERAQFARNEPVYQPDAIPVPGFRPDGCRYSLLEYLLREMEQVHGKIRRYTSPDEYAFFPEDLPPLVLPPITYEQVRCGTGTPRRRRPAAAKPRCAMLVPPSGLPLSTHAPRALRSAASRCWPPAVPR